MSLKRILFVSQIHFLTNPTRMKIQNIFLLTALQPTNAFILYAPKASYGLYSFNPNSSNDLPETNTFDTTTNNNLLDRMRLPNEEQSIVVSSHNQTHLIFNLIQSLYKERPGRSSSINRRLITSNRRIRIQSTKPPKPNF